jgi:hydroxymethylglutaryl-CoA lyase
MRKKIKITECPRDAMQGIHEFIPTERKIEYLKTLLKCGFHTLDFGSFVSPKAIPQLKDTEEVAEAVSNEITSTGLLAITGNAGGAERASAFPAIKYIGYPHSVSEKFLARNINSNIRDSLDRIRSIQEICGRSNKEQIVYISMAFGNPYDEPWNAERVAECVQTLAKEGIRSISLSDTIGEAKPEDIRYLFTHLIPSFPDIEFGAHFHTTPENWHANVDAAYQAGCRKFDAAIMGFGGCPMAKNELTGNLPTENLLQYFSEIQEDTDVNLGTFAQAMQAASALFNTYH